jgi:NADH:ubiquinone oxidoreductase subunit 2 (subunit N)
MSEFETHSLLNVIFVVAACMSAATYIPLSKTLDVFGRAEGFLIMCVFATLGLILMASSNGIAIFCAAYVSPLHHHLLCFISSATLMHRGCRFSTRSVSAA